MLDFGSMIRNMRRQRELTQEQLAETLGVTCQAVSKWETNTSYPDISLLPIIADYFGVSIDTLLGHDISRRQEEIAKACAKAHEMIERKSYFEAISFLREMLIKYPGNDRLMYELAWALSGTLSLTGSYEFYDEAIIMYHKILEISTDTELRTKVCRDLVYRYLQKGDTEKARFYLDMLPPFSVCREYHLAMSNILDGQELANALWDQIRLYGEALYRCLEYFESEKILTADQKLPLTTESARDKMRMVKEILA